MVSTKSKASKKASKGFKPDSCAENTAYYRIGQRVLLGDRPGFIHSYSLKVYPYPIGYNVMLDGQKDKGHPRGHNILAAGLIPLDGKYYRFHIPPRSPRYEEIDWQKFNEIPAEEFKAPKVPGYADGYVYLAEAQGTGRFKIGRSVNAVERGKNLQRQSPFPLVILHVIESYDSCKLERTLHRRYAACRVHGEWFQLSQDQVAEICGIGSDLNPGGDQ